MRRVELALLRIRQVFVFQPNQRKMAASSPPAKKFRSEAAVSGGKCAEVVNGKSCIKEATNGDASAAEDPAVTLFREYIRIPSISRGDDYLKHYGSYTQNSLIHIIYLLYSRFDFPLGYIQPRQSSSSRTLRMT